MRDARRRGREAAIDAALARIDAILSRAVPLLAELERNERRYSELLARCEAQAGIVPVQAGAATVH